MPEYGNLDLNPKSKVETPKILILILARWRYKHGAILDFITEQSVGLSVERQNAEVASETTIYHDGLGCYQRYHLLRAV